MFVRCEPYEERGILPWIRYLNSWVEKEGSFTSRRAWKGYDFGILDELNEEQLIFGSNRAKSIYFTDKGIQEARELIKKVVPELEQPGNPAFGGGV